MVSIFPMISSHSFVADPKTQVITIISKGQPGPSSMKALCARIKTCKKPVVVVLLGADGTEVCFFCSRAEPLLEITPTFQFY